MGAKICGSARIRFSAPRRRPPTVPYAVARAAVTRKPAPMIALTVSLQVVPGHRDDLEGSTASSSTDKGGAPTP
ncbi:MULTISPECIES: hypothetical protein [unclassified Streptomyces]|uniref:hypothetical protein n=1 Tax=unclassified Streptomyces TaxID=2593676 RepID=UPI002E786B26|nr:MULTISPECIES: hypothetical protein [unclassified Streptomyces]MEE1758460.1 hypothetical protein [Streptomyces sp. SP18BB07]MEE1830096.1 hypothetical protein [Streptomyces sp. SP17KL33]